jgi:two-component system, NarL family, response regulator DesR
VRDTRVVYVENDPALRGILSRDLAKAPGLLLVLSTGSAAEALASPQIARADVALLDLALGVGELNGIDLGIALRSRNPDVGIVVYSQYPLKNLARRVPDDISMGWSFIAKSGDMEIQELVGILRSTAQGGRHVDASTAGAVGEPDDDILASMSPRQRAVMALAATGLTAPEVAQRLGVSHDAVRKDLSRSYRLLVGEGEGGDLRTRAVLAYLRLIRDTDWDGQPR